MSGKEEKEDIGIELWLKGGKGERKKRRERIEKEDIGVEVWLKGGKGDRKRKEEKDRKRRHRS